MITIFINGIKLNVKKNITILQACQYLNIDIPKFCYHPNLQIAGNCRMCLVEIKHSIKPVASCAMPVMANMEIFTDTPLIRKSREGILEFLLLNHPLDCPICDQGGECDLQDQTLVFGSDKSRFFEWKRGVEDKNCGPFIKTIMTRCIHCTRCIRFANEICHIDHLGTVGRGNKTEISFYLKNIFYSEFSGNVIDLCPVGALVSKPFTFKNRIWELDKQYRINIFDNIGTPLEIQIYNNKIVRILPKSNTFLNMEWITNQTRFFFDSLQYQRLIKPLYKKNNKFIEISWEQAFFLLKSNFSKQDSSNIQTLLGSFIDFKSLFYLKIFLNNLGTNNYISIRKPKRKVTNNYFFDLIFLKRADLILLVGCNLQSESPILNLYLKKKKNIFSIGLRYNNIYSQTHLGQSFSILLSILEGKHHFCKKIYKAKDPIFLFGNQLNEIHFHFLNFKKFLLLKKWKWYIFSNELLNRFESSNSNISYLKLPKCLYLYNTDNLFFKKSLKKPFFSVYQGHHFTNDSEIVDLILPGLTLFEKNSLLLNFEGQIFLNKKILSLLQKQNNDVTIFQNLIFYYKFNFLNHISLKTLMPFLTKRKINIMLNVSSPFFTKKYFRYLLNFLHQPNSSNIYFKYSKILSNAIKFIEKKSNFKQ